MCQATERVCCVALLWFGCLVRCLCLFLLFVFGKCLSFFKGGNVGGATSGAAPFSDLARSRDVWVGRLRPAGGRDRGQSSADNTARRMSAVCVSAVGRRATATRSRN